MIYYDLLILPSAEKALRRVTISIKIKLNRCITQLVINYRPAYSKKLRGVDNIFYMIEGLYRILYEFKDNTVTILAIINCKDLETQ
jgi:mRNA-degrading endonuclease RelE of RelBE toxin-antitoxin system